MIQNQSELSGHIKVTVIMPVYKYVTGNYVPEDAVYKTKEEFR